MASKTTNLIHGDPIITIEVGKGLATRNRLPLTTVTRLLTEFKNLMIAIGGEILASGGRPESTPDFGLEVLATQSGALFTPGSLCVQIAITKNTDVGVEAAQAVLQTLHRINEVAKKPPTKEPGLNPLEARIVPYLERLAFVATSAKAEAIFTMEPKLKTPGLVRVATFGEATVRVLKEQRPKPDLIEHGVVAFGKLFQLKDTTGEFSEESTGFWGELRLDNGERWRAQFTPGMEHVVGKLFRKQVQLTGDAHYYDRRKTKLVVQAASLDQTRDYETAFDELWASEGDGADNQPFQEILDARYGG